MTHWKKLNNPDYLGAYEFQRGQEITGTIKTVKQEIVTNPEGKKEECSVLYFTEKYKPLILNVTNAKTIEKMYDTPYIEEWAGKEITMYVARVKAFGDIVEAVRIRPSIPAAQIKCDGCGGDISAFGKQTAAQVAKYTADKYGKALCSECAKKQAEVKTDDKG